MKVAFLGRKDADGVNAEEIETLVRNLIEKENADTFLFGGRSVFDILCFVAVCGLQKIYPHIQMIYVNEYSTADKKPTLVLPPKRFKEVKSFELNGEKGKVFHAGKAYMLRESNLIITDFKGSPWIKHENKGEKPNAFRKKPVWKMADENGNSNYINIKTVKRIIFAKRTDINALFGQSEIAAKLDKAFAHGKQSDFTVNEVFVIAQTLGVSVTAIL